MSLIIQKIPHEDQSFFVVLIFQPDGPENKNWTSPPSDLGNHVFSIYLIMDASEPKRDLNGLVLLMEMLPKNC